MADNPTSSLFLQPDAYNRLELRDPVFNLPPKKGPQAWRVERFLQMDWNTPLYEGVLGTGWTGGKRKERINAFFLSIII